MMPFPDPLVWSQRRVLVTGNTGFKGTWLSCWLQQLGAEVMGLSLPKPPTAPSLWEEVAPQLPTIRADLREGGWQDQVVAFSPEVVLHLAAQSIVGEGYRSPAATFHTNVMGTARLLEALAGQPALGALVVVTTDKVYDARQSAPYLEGAFLGGLDPYSASKASTELLCGAWPDRELPLVTARAGNVVGGGDWSSERLVPDMVRAWSAGRRLVLRDPSGVRPWQHVLEPLRGYLLYAEAVLAGRDVPAALNFGPRQDDLVSVGALAEHCAGIWAQRHQGPLPAWGAMDQRPYAETGVLAISSELAGAQLGWAGALTWQQTMALTLDFYVDRAMGEPVDRLVRRDLAAYTALAGGDAAS
jgi:CDP-glucose 4,6-dehydratase